MTSKQADKQTDKVTSSLLELLVAAKKYICLAQKSTKLEHSLQISQIFKSIHAFIYLYLTSSLLTLSRGGGPDLRIQGEGQIRLRYIFWPYLSNFKSDLSGIKSKCEIHIIKPLVEKKCATILKIGRVITIFARLTKIQKRVNKKQENSFIGHFWIDAEKVILFPFVKQAKTLWVF